MPVVAARLRIRNDADTADLVTFAMADMSDWPEGDGTSVNVVTGAMRSGSYVVRIVDNLALTAVLNDGGGRSRLKSRRALVEVQTDGGAWVQRIGGYVTRVSIRDGYDAEIEVGESLRVPATALVPDAALGATLNRGAFVGGPLISQWGPFSTLGGWRCSVTAISGRTITVQVLSSYAPPAYMVRPDAAGIGADVATVERLMAPYVVAAEATLVDFDFNTALIPQLSARITRLSDNQVTVGTPRANFTSDFLNTGPDTLLIFALASGVYTMKLTAPTGQPLPSVGNLVSLAITTAATTPESPAYLDGHPIDVVATLYDSIGVRRNTASFTAVKNALGAQLRYAERVAEPFELQPWIEKNISGPLGVAFLPDANGDIAATYMRQPLTATPSPILTVDDLSAVESLYEDTEDSSVARLVWEQALYRRIDRPTVDDPADAVLRDVSRQEFTLDSGLTYATRTIQYLIDGQYYIAGAWPGSPEVVSSVQRGQLATRYGRGSPETVFHGRRDSSTVAALNIGSYLRCNVPSLPSGTARLRTQSGISRVMQVTGITEGVGERVLTLEDLGPVGAAIGTAPTLTMATSGYSFSATITNAATLITAGSSVRVEIALTSGAAPASSEWTTLRLMTPDDLTTAAIVSGVVTTAPTTVYARARSERDGFLPSAYSASSSVSFSALTSITGLTGAAVSGDGSRLLITWSRSVTDDAIYDVFVRLSSEPQGTGIYAVTLPPNSTTANASGLTASTLYTIDVRVRSQFGPDQSVWVSTTATTASGTTTLSNPSALVAYVPFAGAVALDGIVTGTPLPNAEVEMATETAVGSGTFGSYAAAGTAVAVAGGAFTQQISAASDNLLRRLRARAVRAGATSSSWVVAPTDVLPDSSGML